MAGKREIIKEQALRLFADRGIDGVSVRDIAQECDMKASNLYSHFASKEALVAEIFSEGHEAYGFKLAQSIIYAEDFRSRLNNMLQVICELHDQDQHRFRFLIFSQHVGYVEIQNEDYNSLNIVVEQVQKAMLAGEIPDRDPQLIAMAIVGIVVQIATGILYGRINGTMLEKLQDIQKMCWRVCL